MFAVVQKQTNKPGVGKKKKYDKFGKGKKNRNTYIRWTRINFVYIVFERPCLWLLPNFSWRRTQKLLGPVWECRLRIKCFRLQTLVFVIQLIVPTHTNFLREKSLRKYGNQKARNFMNRSNQEFNFCFQDKMNRQTKHAELNLKFWEKTKNYSNVVKTLDFPHELWPGGRRVVFLSKR